MWGYLFFAGNATKIIDILFLYVAIRYIVCLNMDNNYAFCQVCRLNRLTQDISIVWHY